MRRIIVGITGASGTLLGVRLLEILRDLPDVETHLVMSPAAIRTLLIETDRSLDSVTALADFIHNHKDIGASIASGSFRHDGMIIAPCSIKTLSSIAHCTSDDLIGRASDVTLKERRKLVLLLRETPLHAGHIHLMDLATRAGAIIMPAVIGLYYRPQTIMDMVDHLVGRATDLVGIESGTVNRWKGQPPRAEGNSDPDD